MTDEDRQWFTEQFNGVDEQFHRIDKQLNWIDERCNQLETKLEHRITGVLEEIHNQGELAEKRYLALRADFKAKANEWRAQEARFEVIDLDLEQLRARIAKLELPPQAH